MINLEGHLIEHWLVPTCERRPETTGLVGAEEAQVEETVVAPVFEGTCGPTATGNDQTEVEFTACGELNLLHGVLQKPLELPKQHVDVVLSRCPNDLA
jgi:hypothetical protein